MQFSFVFLVDRDLPTKGRELNEGCFLVFLEYFPEISVFLVKYRNFGKVVKITEKHSSLTPLEPQSRLVDNPVKF